MNYNNKKFKPLYNSDNGAVSNDMIFEYQQSANILSCRYQGQHILEGHLIGIVGPCGTIDMCYHQVHQNGHLMTGICISTPEILDNGKIRLHEKWQWTSGDRSKGSSVLEEV